MLPALRIAAALFLLGGVIVIGWSEAPLSVIAPLAFVFTLSFGFGRWRAWVTAAKTGTLGNAILGQVGTLLVQAVLVGMLYLMGRGLAAIAGPIALPFSLVIAVVSYSILAIVLGALIALLEARLPAYASFEDVSTQVDQSPPSLRASEDNFFGSLHHSQMVREDGSQSANPGLSEAQIAQEEARLGISLPPLLARLYMRQNGGSEMGWYVPDTIGLNIGDGGWIAVFSGYDDCVPLTQMRSLEDTLSDFASPTHQPESFPDGSDRLFVLASGWGEVLFLDYRDRDTPRVGFVYLGGIADLKAPEWERQVLWWDDFSAFFNDVRRRNLDA